MRKHIFDFLTYLRNERNVSHHTERSYLSDLEQLSEFLGDTDSDFGWTIKRSGSS